MLMQFKTEVKAKEILIKNNNNKAAKTSMQHF